MHRNPRHIPLLTAAVAATLACALPVAAQAAPSVRPAAAAAGDAFAAGEAIVRFAPGTNAGERGAARRAASVDFERSLRIPRAQLVEISGDVEAAISRLQRQPGVAHAQPNYRYEAFAAPAGWTTSVINGGVEWGLSGIAATGSRSASDSPAGNYGNAIDPSIWAESRLVKSAGADLSAERGCRLHFRTRYALEDGFDFLEVGAVRPNGLASLVAQYYTGFTGGSFVGEQVSISAHDGEPDVRPWFALLSDEVVADDGAYVDDLRIICRDEAYVDAIASGALYDQPGSGSYVRFSGTSMAAPHVAGVAALVRAAAPSATYAEVISAIEDGGSPLVSLAGKTATGCAADAVGAISVILEGESGPCASAAAPPAPAPPDDTFLGELWGLDDVQLPNPGVGALHAWETTKGDGQTIAIVDTGVDLSHPDLVGNLWTGPGGVKGFDIVDDDGDPDDYEFHGSHVAGTAAATADNGLGIAGVAPEARIMPVRVLDGDGSGTSADIADGIVLAAENGADVINLSLGGSAPSDSLMSTAIATAATFDAVVVAAAGNAGGNNDVSPTVPCSLPQANIVCVAAITQAGALAGFSNFGVTSVDVGAPGTNILSAKTEYGAPLLAEGFEEAPSTAPLSPPPTSTTQAPPPPLAAPTSTPLARPDLSRAKLRVRVRSSRFGYRFRATPGLRGSAIFRTRVKALVPTRRGAVRRHRTLARPRFSVGPAGKVVLRPRLSRRNLRILRRNGRLLLKVRVTVRDDSGRTATAVKRLRLLAPPRR